MENHPQIILCGINSTYQHTSFGLRYLKANLFEHESKCEIFEFTTSQSIQDIADTLLNLNAKIIGIGVYIWNTNEVLSLIQIIKQISPSTVIILGGPEISYETQDQPHLNWADYIVKGEGEKIFYDLIHNYFQGRLPDSKVVGPLLPEIKSLKLPYYLYSLDDIKNRVIYVEASRGCPYKCEYCLSSLDTSVRNFDIDSFLAEIEILIQKGCRQFKFVDRTFNLSPAVSEKVLTFFLQRIHLELFIHFEMVPDRLPDGLKKLISQFPLGALQFEIGIQTLNDSVAKLISRRQDLKKTQDNFRFLKNESKVHTHADLIVGLPGENIESFAVGFDTLLGMQPDEIQVGLLKRLKGAPLSRHEKSFSMIFELQPPYQILQTQDMTYTEIIQMTRFSKYWDLIANSGNFKQTTNWWISNVHEKNNSFFYEFNKLSTFLYSKLKRSHSISLLNLSSVYLEFLLQHYPEYTQQILKLFYFDYCGPGKRDVPYFLKNYDSPEISAEIVKSEKLNRSSLNKRQRQHQHLS